MINENAIVEVWGVPYSRAVGTIHLPEERSTKDDCDDGENYC